MREISKKMPKDERILVFGVAIFVCVFLGPFDTINDLHVWERVAFWTIAVTSVGIVIELCMVAVLESKLSSKLHIGLKFLIGGMIGAVPGASFMVAINMLFRPDHLSDLNFPGLWVKVTIMSLLIAGLDQLIWVRFRSSQSDDLVQTPHTEIQDVPPDTVPLPRLFSRLPDKLREGQIISLSMQDHYVEISTTLGSEMLLMRLSDAIDLLDGMAGAQTHRSHWVAQCHAVSMAKAGRRHELTLSNGAKLPVSKSYKTAVETLLNEKGQA